MKLNFKKIWILFAAAFYIILFSNTIFSNSNPFTTGKTCSDVFGTCDNATINDTLDSCNGTQSASGDIARVKEIYINASSFFYGDGINITCTFRRSGSGNNTMQVWYNDNNNWYLISNWNANTTNSGINYSIALNVNSTEGTHIVRCMINYCSGVPSPACPISSQCVNSTDGGTNWDNDDVNFTVTAHLTYDFWNLTNYTTGANISSGQTFNRNDSSGNITYINISAHWTKNISFAQVEHNGTGTWVNYTICTYPNCIGNWTNYTLNLSNSSEFNVTTIGIRAIYVNDTYSATNNTSPELYFNLSAGNAPSVTNFWFNYSGITTNITNKYTNLTIYANVSDDVGLSRVTANITYPSNNSTIVNMTGDTSPGWHLWNYTFGSDLHLNSTGNYTVRITAFDIGNQNKSSGTDYPEENMSFTVYSNYTLNLTSNYTVFNRGENVTVQALDVNNFTADSVNWIVNVTKINETSNFTPQQTTFNYTILPSDPEGNYTILANASKNNNTGNSSWNFNISKNLSLTISTSQTLSPGNNVEFLIGLKNARGESYNKTVSANMSCPDGVHNLTFSSGQASQSCTIPSTYSTQFTVNVDVTDDYNNTGTNSITFTTTSAPSSGGGGGGGGPVSVETKKCSDNTSYNQCSSNRPYYCLNGNLTQNCSICGCNPGYSCQPSGSCILTKEEDFNFTLASEEAEINQGEDATIIGHLTNTGNTILDLMTFLNVSNNCCNISIPSTLELKEREEKEFTISIHVPLITSTGEYLIKVGIGTAYFKKEKTFKVIVLRSPYYDYLSKIETTLASLEKEIQEYKKAGINVGNLENLVEQAKLTLYNANSSVNNDQVNALADSISDLNNNVNYVSTSLTLLRGQRFLSQNSWLIILLIISSILTIYFVPEVLIPLTKIEKEIKKLKNEEKNLVSSRVETEKQYFLRKIDENTFSKIMITKQDNILKLRGTIHEKENDRIKILTRTHPKEIIKWFASGIKNLPKNIKKLFVKLIKAPKINLFKGKPKMVI